MLTPHHTSQPTQEFKPDIKHSCHFAVDSARPFETIEDGWVADTFTLYRGEKVDTFRFWDEIQVDAEGGWRFIELRHSKRSNKTAWHLLVYNPSTQKLSETNSSHVYLMEPQAVLDEVSLKQQLAASMPSLKSQAVVHYNKILSQHAPSLAVPKREPPPTSEPTKSQVESAGDQGHNLRPMLAGDTVALKANIAHLEADLAASKSSVEKEQDAHKKTKEKMKTLKAQLKEATASLAETQAQLKASEDKHSPSPLHHRRERSPSHSRRRRERSASPSRHRRDRSSRSRSGDRSVHRDRSPSVHDRRAYPPRQSRHRGHGRSHEHSRERSRECSRDRSRDRSRERSRDRTRDRSRDRRERSRTAEAHHSSRRRSRSSTGSEDSVSASPPRERKRRHSVKRASRSSGGRR